MLRDTSAEWKQYDWCYARTCMNNGKTLETWFLGRVSFWSLDVQYCCCIYVVHVAHVMLCAYGALCIFICSVVYI